jgi:hypothetical protein
VPLTFRVDPAQRIVTITGDYAEAREWRALLSAVAKDPHYAAGFGFLRDLRASTHPVSAQAVIGIIGVVREFWDVLGARRAAIVTRLGIDNPAVVAHALAEHEHIPLRTFTSYDDAVRWLQEG